MQQCALCEAAGRCQWPGSPHSACAHSPQRTRISGRHPWRPIATPRVCHLCGTPRSCEARIVFTFSEAEYSRPAMRLAVHRYAYGLGWRAADFHPNLLAVLEKANIHFKDIKGRVFDLDLSALETELDAYDAPEEFDTLRHWVGETLLKMTWVDTLPELRGVGKARFMVIASILTATSPELEEELIRLANKER